MTRSVRNQKGFTLVELMVVIAIIGILAAIGIPQFNKYVRKAETTDAITNMAKLAEHISAYASVKGAGVAASHLAATKTQTADGSTTDISDVMPTWTPTDNTKFDYAITAMAVSGDGVNFCITATGASNAGNSGGLIYYDSDDRDGDEGWTGHANVTNYMGGTDPGGC